MTLLLVKAHGRNATQLRFQVSPTKALKELRKLNGLEEGQSYFIKARVTVPGGGRARILDLFMDGEGHIPIRNAVRDSLGLEDGSRLELTEVLARAPLEPAEPVDHPTLPGDTTRRATVEKVFEQIAALKESILAGESQTGRSQTDTDQGAFYRLFARERGGTDRITMLLPLDGLRRFATEPSPALFRLTWNDEQVWGEVDQKDPTLLKCGNPDDDESFDLNTDLTTVPLRVGMIFSIWSLSDERYYFEVVNLRSTLEST